MIDNTRLILLVLVISANIPQQPVNAEQFEIMATKSKYCRVFRGKQETARIYCVESSEDPSCQLYVETASKDNRPNLRKRNPEPITTLVFGRNSLHISIADLNLQSAKLLFGTPISSRSKNYVTYKLHTPDGVNFLVDMAFAHNKLERYRVHGALVVSPSWQNPTTKQSVPLIRICGMGFVQYSPGFHNYPIRVRTPTMSDDELRAATQNGE